MAKQLLERVMKNIFNCNPYSIYTELILKKKTYQNKNKKKKPTLTFVQKTLRLKSFIIAQGTFSQELSLLLGL